MKIYIELVVIIVITLLVAATVNFYSGMATYLVGVTYLFITKYCVTGLEETEDQESYEKN
ncbi:hypothetical protein [Staphylococcus lugdunensis]|uniref:Phage protein n=1 Tax=Staphylococcus lugdunensis TaxID=28035 RepID=A0ABD4EGI0_STALU|nr:hypothetical protein [Staphylococcus lugdunensis]KXA38893.1 hypothetical protein HMPREF3225_00998 [Staphylococcus lugdunensis]MCO7040703.1 hypothetical protein [Staphylococcus lugdunensis]QEX29666.1 hypothetical protein FO458_10465 [Staphylococcus lugdunensis]